jgi:hypothetical protein
MPEKSYVTLEQKLCPICGTAHDSGALLLDARMRPLFEHKTATGWALCEPCAKLKADGYVALVACDESKSKVSGDRITDPGDAYRLGAIMHIRAAVWSNIFNVPEPACGFAYVEPDVIEKLKPLATEATT